MFETEVNPETGTDHTAGVAYFEALGALDGMAPGPDMASLLTSIDPESLDGYQRVIVMRAHHRLAAHHEALAMRHGEALIGEFQDLEDLTEHRSAEDAAATEIRAALTLTRRAADSFLDLAITTLRRFPQVWEALAAGHIDLAKARTICNGVEDLSDTTGRAIIDQVIAGAPDLTTGQLFARIRRLRVAIDPDEATSRQRAAVVDRRVVSEPTPDGAANLLGLDLPPVDATRARDHLDRIARSLRRQGDSRTMDQLRADAFIDLLTGNESLHRSVIHVTTTLDTLTELAALPAAELNGYGPMVADIAEQTGAAQGTTWDYSVTDGRAEAIHTGTTRRHPNADQRRRVEARSPICAFPGCRMPSTDCEFDHTTPWADSKTTDAEDGAPLCSHDHGNRDVGWSYRRTNVGYEWTSPLGHTYHSSGTPP